MKLNISELQNSQILSAKEIQIELTFQPLRYYRHGWQSYVCMIDENKAPLPRNVIMEKLQEQGISTRPGTHAIHMLGLYRERFGYSDDDFPGARDCDRLSMAIPLHNRMSADDYAYVADALRQIG